MSLISQNQRPVCKEFSADLSQAAGTYDICAASGGGCYVEDVVVYVTTAAATLTSVSIQTNQANSTTVMSAVEGAVANLISQKVVSLALSRPIYLADGQKLQYTIVGATGTGALLVVPKYYPTNSSADLV
jgi:hypothetical protein